MVADNNWITPTYDGENRYDKPILFYWLMAASYKMFGVNEFSARFPSAISAFLLSVAVFLFARRFGGEQGALYAAISLVLSPYFLLYSHAAVTDMTLTLFITLSLLSFYLSAPEGAVRSGTRSSPMRPNAYIYGFYAFSALAFLTKGLIGILFPFGIAIIFVMIAEGLPGIRRVLYPKGLAVFVIISAPWYIAEFAVNGREFFEQFFIKHHFKRYLDVISGHSGPVYYYFLALIAGLTPWIFFLPGGFRKLLGKHEEPQPAGNGTTEGKQVPADHHGRSSVELFALIWFSFIFVFFSLSTTKLPNYVLPSVPALCLLISSGMSKENSWLRFENVLMTAVLIVAGAAALISIKYLHKIGVFDTGWVIAAAIVLFAMASAGICAFFAKKTFYGVLSALMFILLILVSIKATPLANDYLQSTLYRYSLYAKERLHDDEKIVTLGINNPSIVFYSGHRVVRTGHIKDLMPLLTQDKRLLIISTAKEIGTLEGLGFTLLQKDRKYALLERQ
jgi:4-amino-4-deoxy-L-arabinose transferase-like glycosyltransferase